MKIYFRGLLFLPFFFFGCVKNTLIESDEPLICTEQFVTISLEIKGKTPSDYYTIRSKTGDTLILDFVYENYYPIVNDNLVKDMKRNQIETFVFVGIRPEKSIRELFKIKSDGCHVLKISGIESID